jgi:hypothetical protein
MHWTLILSVALTCSLPSALVCQERPRRNAITFDGLGMRSAPPLWIIGYERVLRGDLRVRIGSGGRERYDLAETKLHVWPATLQFVGGRGAIRTELGAGVVFGWDDGEAFQVPFGVLGVRTETPRGWLLRVAAMPVLGAAVTSPFWTDDTPSVLLSIGFGRRF